MSQVRFYEARHVPCCSDPEGMGLHHVEMPNLYVWLTTAEALGYAEDRLVEAYEDRDGEMVSCSVMLKDLYVQKEC